jgi:hypothetical protein
VYGYSISVREKQVKPKINYDRGVFIDKVQVWFLQRNKLWTMITFVTLASIVILQFILTFLTQINPQVRHGIYPILIPMLVLFVFSIFWRNTVTAFLSLAGAMCLYAGMYYAYASRFGIIQNKFLAHVNNPTPLHLPPSDTVAEFYFLMGIFAAVLCVAVAFRPSLFRAKGTPVGLPYPIWTNSDNERNYPRFKFGANNSLSLIPVQSLLSFGERHLISNYKYIQVMIGGRIYFVSLDEWVPQTVTYIIRDRDSGSLVGIPKVSDGFNIW